MVAHVALQVGAGWADADGDARVRAVDGARVVILSATKAQMAQLMEEVRQAVPYFFDLNLISPFVETEGELAGSMAAVALICARPGERERLQERTLLRKGGLSMWKAPKLVPAPTK